jgi:pimeloyl-ACP methyl ester carboxylesterase/DNA-binding winged helix-turn-helix (wHTH) protein
VSRKRDAQEPSIASLDGGEPGEPLVRLRRVLLVGPYRLDLGAHRLERDGDPIALRPQAFDLLAYLAANPGRLVSKDELLAQVWSSRFVEEGVVKVAVSELRRALGDDAHDPGIIETVHCCGYKLVAPVEEELDPEELGAPRPPAFRESGDFHQEIQFCLARDGVRLAYATLGSGPTLVKAANWLSHLDLDRNVPLWHHWLVELSRRHRLVRYDERGTGLSDWSVPTLAFDSWVSDLEAVVEASEPGRFDLLGISQGAAVAIAYAVRHPERVRRLVLVGGYARGWARRPDQVEATARRELLVEATRLGWSGDNPAFRQLWTSHFIPEATADEMRAFNAVQRASTSTENALAFLEEFGRIDIEALLPRVEVPTVVLHSRRDAAVPFDEGRRLAAGIRGAGFVSLDSANHLLLASEPAWSVFVEEVHRFLATG